MDAAVPREPDRALHEVEAALACVAGVTRFETTEPQDARRHMEALYGPHGLRVEGDAMRMQVRGFEIAQLHVDEIRYGLPAVASKSELHGHWVFSYLRRGTVRRSLGGEVIGAGAAGANQPDTVLDLVMSADMELLNLRVPEADMRQACRALLGEDLAHALRFELTPAAGAPHVATLLRVLHQLAATPRYPHAMAARFECSVRDAALYELLLAWPNNATRALDAFPALPASTRLARDFIHAHAAELPTVAEVAAACGVGVRALARGFEKHLGTSPLKYLLDYRLDRVREALQRAPAGATVTAIAFDWGFLHLGSFAARYRERFGESPSETLRRH